MVRPINRNDLVRKLRSHGYEGPYSGGKHLFMVRGQHRLALPNPHGGMVGAGLLARILAQAGISTQEWES